MDIIKHLKEGGKITREGFGKGSYLCFQSITNNTGIRLRSVLDGDVQHIDRAYMLFQGNEEWVEFVHPGADWAMLERAKRTEARISELRGELARLENMGDKTDD